jgi:hypothetical protein
LQSKKVAKLDPKFKALMADPVNRRRGRRQATVLALGVIGFGTFCTLDAFGHIDTTGLSGKDALFAAIVALLFVTGGLYYTRRR